MSAVLETDVAELDPVFEVVEELELEETKFGFWYMLSRTDPPQYSVEFPLQTMLQPVVPGELPETGAAPELMVFPQ